jgi:sugar (pentulose or hexulose) kinase
MHANHCYLAIDLGATSGRVIAGIHDGKRLSLEEAHRFGNGAVEVDGTFRWDIEKLFGEVKTGIAKACAKYGDAVVSVGVDTWGVDYGLIGGDGKLLEQPYAYRDERTQGMEAAICERVPREEVYRATGIQFAFYNTLLQVFAAVSSGSEAVAQAERLLFTPDLINYWLTGRQVNERSIASTSQMYNPHTGTWATDLLERLGIPTRMLGDIVDPGTVLGELTAEVRKETGAQALKVVAPGCHDTACAVAAVPATGDSHAYLSSGTWSIMGIESPEPVTTAEALSSGFTNEGGVFGTTRVLRNICGLWLLEECKRTWAEAGEDHTYEELLAMAAQAPPFAAVVDPDSPDFATPGDMPARIRAFCERTGQTPPADKGSVIRTALESLALKYRSVFAQLETFMQRTLDTLHIVGGGTKNEMLNQFTANALDRRVVTGPVEATAAGNVMMQMVATGQLASLDEGRALIRDSFETGTYEPSDTAAWKAAHARFVEVEQRCTA